MKNIRILCVFKQQSLLYYFVLLATSMSIFIMSCQKDIAFLPNTSKTKKVEAIPAVSLNEAKDFLTTTKVNSFAGSAIKLNPLWTDAYLDTALSGKQYLVVSLALSGFKINHSAADIRLMFYKDSVGTVRSQLFAFSPTPEYKERKHGVLQIEDFCGVLMFYALDGRLKKALYCQNGSVVGYGRESRGAGLRDMYQVYVEFDCEGCGWWVTVYDETGSGGNGNTGYDPWAGGTGGGGSNGGSSSGSGGSGGSGGGNPNGCPTCMPEDGPNPPNLPLIGIINQLTECRSSVFATLQNKLTGDFAQFLNNFQANSNFNIQVKESYLQGADINNDAATVKKANPGTNSGFTWEITLNRNVLDFSSREYIAITIYHEVLHAYLDAYFPSIGTTDLNTQHHQYMANQCVGYMAAMLQQLYPNLSSSDATALSWQGLNGNFKFKNGVVEPNSYWNMLPEATRINYINRNNQFKNGKVNGTGTQCN